jgi:hypothetical protein
MVPVTNFALGVLLGNGDGTFQAAVVYASGGFYALSVLPRNQSPQKKKVILRMLVGKTMLVWVDAANEAGMSRRYGGIHFRAADLAGRGSNYVASSGSAPNATSDNR